MLAIFRYLLSSAVMSHPHLHRRPSLPARPACLSAAALSARFRANFSARILPLGSTLAWRYTLFLEIWFVSWLTVSFLLAAAISQRIPPRCAAKKRLACPFFRTNSPLLTLILFGTIKEQQSIPLFFHLNVLYLFADEMKINLICLINSKDDKKYCDLFRTSHYVISYSCNCHGIHR